MPDWPLRWVYRDGSGSSCWGCERVYQMEAHAYVSRGEHREELSSDLVALENHPATRRVFFERQA